ncbi:MAG: stage V sporulation protein AD [Firmicutes bacterium]|nr:stage V sporulation protein AD [Bacillota bacterium]
MAGKFVGKQTVTFSSTPSVLETFSIVGPMEGRGPWGSEFDTVIDDEKYGEKTWEKAERKLVIEAVSQLLAKSKLQPSDIDFLLAGDLLNQITSANFAAAAFPISFFGLYGACSTIAEAMILAAMLVDGDYGEKVIAAASSHNKSVERQYRFPIELGVQRPPTAQWTVTGCGSILLGRGDKSPKVTFATVGKVVDMGAKDSNDMGSAMAPAAADTLTAHFRDLAKNPSDYDLIITGDLGKVGSSILAELMEQAGFPLAGNHIDCGASIYAEDEDVHAGGSGCAALAVGFGSHFYPKMLRGEVKKVLLAGTGALHSPLSTQQNETIPCICHAVAIEVI